MKNRVVGLFAIVLLALSSFLAVCSDTAHAETKQQRGPETNLPLPRFVSLKAEANARRGPGMDHRVDWTFKHRGLPLQVIAEYGNWRKVVDADGTGGWIHFTLLRGRRTVLIRTDRVRLREQPTELSATIAEAEAGAIAILKSCKQDWCRIEADGHRGWVIRSAIWGVGENDITP